VWATERQLLGLPATDAAARYAFGFDTETGERGTVLLLSHNSI
jgi:hypothetical protein